MSKLLKIRKVINEMKRNSCLLSMQNSETTLESSTETERSKTVDVDPGFKLLPVADRPQSGSSSADNDSKSEQFCDDPLWSKVDCRPTIKEKKSQNVPSFRIMKKNRDFFNQTVRNVSELMASPIGTHVRINRVKENKYRHLSTGRTMETEEPKKQEEKHCSIDVKFKPRRERSSPLKRSRKGWASRVRKTLSPKKHSSPVSKFQISAWETTQDFQFQLN